MKKILFVANVAKEHILKFHVPSIQRFKESGWTVDVACSGNDIVPYCDHQFHMCWKRSPFTIKTLQGVKDLKEIIKQGNYDVIYCHTPVGGLIGRLAARSARKHGTKVIYFVHGFHFYNGAPKVNWMVYYPIEKILARWTDKMITVNSEDFQNAKNLLKCKKVLQIDGMGINLKNFRQTNIRVERAKIRNELSIPMDAWTMIYLAELIPNKNQIMLLDVLKLVQEKHSNTYLILAGIDHYHGLVQEYAKQIGVAEHLRYLGWRTDKESLYSAADICTATSIREGFGLNLVEAMAIGLPVVATRNRGHKTIIIEGKNGYLVDLDDKKGMADKIVDVLEGNSLVSPKNIDLQKYDQDEIAKRIIEYVSA